MDKGTLAYQTHFGLMWRNLWPRKCLTWSSSVSRFWVSDGSTAYGGIAVHKCSANCCAKRQKF